MRPRSDEYIKYNGKKWYANREAAMRHVTWCNGCRVARYVVENGSLIEWRF